MSLERVVYKYDIRPGQRIIDVLGDNPVVRHVSAIHDQIYIWIEHDLYGRASLKVEIVPTVIKREDPDFQFFGTVLMYDGRLVFHIYGEITPLPDLG